MGHKLVDMWRLDAPDILPLPPAEQLWVIAQAVEENGGPAAYVTALRAVADRLEELGWWLAEPLDRRPAGSPGLNMGGSQGILRSPGY